MSKLSFKAVFVSLLVGVVLDVLIGVLAFVYLMMGSLNENMTSEEITYVIDTMTHASDFLMFSLVGGSLTTVFAGYLAGLIGKEAPYLNAGCMGVFGAALGIYLAGDYPLWFDLGGVLITIPAALLGAYLSRPKGLATA